MSGPSRPPPHASSLVGGNQENSSSLVPPKGSGSPRTCSQWAKPPPGSRSSQTWAKATLHPVRRANSSPGSTSTQHPPHYSTDTIWGIQHSRSDPTRNSLLVGTATKAPHLGVTRRPAGRPPVQAHLRRDILPVRSPHMSAPMAGQSEDRSPRLPHQCVCRTGLDLVAQGLSRPRCETASQTYQQG